MTPESATTEPLRVQDRERGNSLAGSSDDQADSSHAQPGKSRLPSRTTVNFCLDFLLLGLMVGLLWVAVIVRFVFPAGSGAEHWVLWGMRHHEWSNVQFMLVAVLSLGVTIHLMLHWTWVCGVITKYWSDWTGGPKRNWDNGVRTLVGVGGLVVLVNVLGLLTGLAAIMIERVSP